MFHRTQEKNTEGNKSQPLERNILYQVNCKAVGRAPITQG